nr:hypothetical protein [Tanacetum cinerariifolium]
MEAPPLPDYIPGPEALPSPDCIPGPEYPEYLLPADDVLPAEEQPLPAAESPGYITDLKPEMEPEEEDGDDEKFEGNSIDYPTSKGDDDANDDGDDLSEDDVDDKKKEESLDCEEDKEEHLALIVPALALNSFISASEDSDKTEPFEEGETSATPPPSALHVAARISVRPHIPMPFHSESEDTTDRDTTAVTYTTTYYIISIPLLLPSTSGSESIPEAKMPLRKRTRFITPTGGYELGESSVAAATRQIRPTLTVDVSRRAKDILIGRLRRERRYFCTLSTTYAQEFAHTCDYCTHIMDYCQSREIHTSTLVTQIEALQRDVSTLQGHQIDDEDRLTRHIQHEHAQRDAALEDENGTKASKTTRANPDPTRTTTVTEPMTHESINNLIAQHVTEALAEYETQRNSVVNGDTSHTTRIGPRTVRPTRECTYKDYLNSRPLKFNDTKGVIDDDCEVLLEGEVKKLEVKLWNLK